MPCDGFETHVRSRRSSTTEASPSNGTTIAWVAFMSSGYRNPPNGRLRREAVPRLQGRAHQRKGAAAQPRRRAAEAQDLPQRWRRRKRPPGRPPPDLTLDVEALDVGDAARPLRIARDLVDCRLPLRVERRLGREQAAPGECDD